MEIADSTHPARQRPALRRLILVAYIALALLYAFASPILEKNDEESHLWFVRHLATGKGLPIQTPGALEAVLQREGSQPPLYYALAAFVARQFDMADFDRQQEPNASPSFEPYGVGNKNLLIITPEKRPFNYSGTSLAALVLRLLSIPLGCLTVWFTYALALRLTRHEPTALLAMAFTAFNPMFLTVTSAVGNDALVIAASTITLYLLADLVMRGVTLKQLVILGIMLGLASLSKVSGVLLLPVAALVIIGRELLRPSAGVRPLQRLGAIIRQGSILVILWLLIAGWWYARNLYLYNDLTGTSVMANMMSPRNFTFAQVQGEFTGFRMSYIAMFGRFTIPADQIVYVIFDALLLAGGLGLLISLLRAVRESDHDRQGGGERRLSALMWSLLTVHIILMLASIMRWTMMTPASQGRLLFPAIAGISTLLATGLLALTRLVPSARARAAAAISLIALSLLLALIAPFRYIIPGYTPPLLAEVPQTITPASQRMGDLAMLRGYRMSPAEVHPGERVRVTAILQALKVPQFNYLLVVKIYGRDNVELARFDTYTGGGLLPSSQWHVNDLWQDEVELTIPLTATAPTILRAQFELYNRGSGDWAQSSDANGTIGAPLYEGSTLLPAQQEIAHAAPVALMGDLAAITGFTATPSSREIRGTHSLSVTINWLTMKRANKDYTVFVHLLDAKDKLWAQQDSPPANGSFPTSRWGSNVVFSDTHVLALPDDLPFGTYTLVVGLYDPTNGERVSARKPTGEVIINNAIMLGQVEIP